MPDPTPRIEQPRFESLLPQVLQTFRGLDASHLQSILGRPLRGLSVMPDKYWVTHGMIYLVLSASDFQTPVASIRSSYSPDPSKAHGQPFAFLCIGARQQEEDHPDQWRGLRINWGKQVFNPVDPIDTLDLGPLHAVPKKGEQYLSDGVNTTEEDNPSAEIIEWGGQEDVHYLDISNRYQDKRATKNEHPSVEVNKVDGVYEIRANADGKRFLTSFNLVLPEHVVIDPQAFVALHKTLVSM